LSSEEFACERRNQRHRARIGESTPSQNQISIVGGWYNFFMGTNRESDQDGSVPQELKSLVGALDLAVRTGREEREAETLADLLDAGMLLFGAEAGLVLRADCEGRRWVVAERGCPPGLQRTIEIQGPSDSTLNTAAWNRTARDEPLGFERVLAQHGLGSWAGFPLHGPDTAERAVDGSVWVIVFGRKGDAAPVAPPWALGLLIEAGRTRLRAAWGRRALDAAGLALASGGRRAIARIGGPPWWRAEAIGAGNAPRRVLLDMLGSDSCETSVTSLASMITQQCLDELTSRVEWTPGETRELRLLSTNRGESDVRIYAAPTGVGPSGATGFVGVAERAETQAERSSDDPETLPEHPKIVVMRIDARDRIVWRNEAAVTGLRLGKQPTSIDGFVHPEDKDVVLGTSSNGFLLARFRWNGSWRRMGVMRWRDAREKNLTLVMIPDAPWIGPASNDASELWGAAASRSGAGIVLLGLDERMIDVNEALAKCLGRTRKSLLGSDWRGITAPEDIPRCEALISELTAGQRDSMLVQKNYLHADGTRIPALTCLSRIVGDNGELHAISAIIHDLSTRHALQSRLGSLMSETVSSQVGSVARVLVLDDQKLVLDTVCAMLEEDGFEAVGVAGGQEARERLDEARAESRDFDALLCDATLIKEDGFELAASLVREHPNLRVVMMSGNADPPRGCVFGVLRKPFSIEQLTAAVQSAAAVKADRAT
jgi:PAS domain S-box-containing protein